VARKIDPKVIVEAGIVGREVEVGVLETELGPRASVPAEIKVAGAHEFYDYEAKYFDEVTECEVPADLPAEVVQRLQQLAVQVFVALDCAGLARVDFFVTTDHEIRFNEINTIPGFTKSSMYPVMWAHSGVPYKDLVSRLIHAALRRGTGLH